jgi:hypothetical protein
LISLVLLAVLYFYFAGRASAATCTHFASPTGSGSGASASSPFKIANFWPVARPGYTLCLLDGEYTGSASMINPPQNLNGTSSARITIQALNDGKVTINGQGSYTPIRLSENDYFVVEGINARNSVSTVVSISRSNNNIIRRVAAWDAADGNHSIFGIHYGTNNLLEDVAGWGVARKIYESSQGGDYTTIRRAWGRWEGSHVVGPKMTYTLAYNNTNMIIENAIGTWSGERMKSTYTLLDYYGNPWTGNGAGTYSNYAVDQPFGIFGIDQMSGSNKAVNSKLLGSIAYVRSSDRFAPAHTVFVTKLDAVEVGDTIAYVQPGSHSSKRPFALYNLQSASAGRLVARNLTSIGSSSSFFGTEWKKTAVAEGTSISSVGNPFTASSAANLCYRYKDGARTNEALWPWPMNQRIANAMAQSGRAAVDVTATIEGMLGPIPAACRGSSNGQPPPTTPPPAPSSPLNLRVSQ